MNMTFIRILFLLLCVMFASICAAAISTEMALPSILVIGTASGLAFGLLLIGIEVLLKNCNLRTFNTALIGLFLGLLMGQAILLLLNSVFTPLFWMQNPEIYTILKVVIFLPSMYIGMILTFRSSDYLIASLPFLKVNASENRKKDLLIDISVLIDSRIVDLASCGLLDHLLIIPRFVIKELQAILEMGDENAKNRARRGLDTLKKLESLPTLNLRFIDNDFPNVKDHLARLIKIAQSLDADILTADPTHHQQSPFDEVRFINIHIVSHALKPISKAGEFINIKIQRTGKEARQGIGYLEDGTMVVVNGGAEFIGETIKAQVLSVKLTASGRMVFCNSTEEGLISEQESAQTIADLDNNHKSLYAMQ